MIPKTLLCLMGGGGPSQSRHAGRQVIGPQWEKEKAVPGWEGVRGKIELVFSKRVLYAKCCVTDRVRL